MRISLNMRVICDTDGLIKMVKAGILEVFARHVELLVSPQVYREAVEEGKVRGYRDALEIERALKHYGRQLQKRMKTKASAGIRTLGAGEREILHMFSHERADVVLSDDRAFLSVLEAQGIPYMTPGAALVFLAEHGMIQIQEAQQALERLRPLIRREQYEAAFRDLQSLRERSQR